MEIAWSAALLCLIVGTTASAIAVIAAFRAYTSAKKVRSMISLQGELAEIRDYVSKIDAWSKRIAARDRMTDQRAAERETSSPRVSRSATVVGDKDELRRRAGLVAGKPPRHGSDAA